MVTIMCLCWMYAWLLFHRKHSSPFPAKIFFVPHFLETDAIISFLNRPGKSWYWPNWIGKWTLLWLKTTWTCCYNWKRNYKQTKNQRQKARRIHYMVRHWVSHHPLGPTISVTPRQLLHKMLIWYAACVVTLPNFSATQPGCLHYAASKWSATSNRKRSSTNFSKCCNSARSNMSMTSLGKSNNILTRSTRRARLKI